MIMFCDAPQCRARGGRFSEQLGLLGVTGATAQSCPRPLQCVAPALTAALTLKLRQLNSSFWEVSSRNFNVVNDLKRVGTTVDRLL